MFTIKNRNHIKTITIINKRYEHIHNEYFEIILKNVPPRWCLLIYINIYPSIHAIYFILLNPSYMMQVLQQL